MQIKNLFLFISLVSSIYPIYSNNALLNLDNSDLDALAIHYGTDKGSEWHHEGVKENKRYPHNYAGTYDYYFSSIRNEPIKFLEIGFWHGESARMWQDYFETLNYILWISVQNFLKNMVKTFLLDAIFMLPIKKNKRICLHFIEKVGGNFDIILDDGGHTVKQQITSFKVLFPFINNGGVYIIEDLHTSYWHSCYGNFYGGNGSQENPSAKEGSTIFFLQELIHDLNYIGARTGSASERYCPQSISDKLNYYQKHIKSIHFYGSLCFIFKK